MIDTADLGSPSLQNKWTQLLQCRPSENAIHTCNSVKLELATLDMKNGDSTNSVSTFSKQIQVRTILGDAKLNIAIFRLAQTVSLPVTILFQPDHRTDIFTLHREPCRSRAIVTFTVSVQLVCHV